MKLTALEIAAGMPLPGTAEPSVRAAAPASTPLAALCDAVRTALARPPCLLSFSGGIDSSVVLAVAADVAQREGLPAPVPITWHFTDAPRAEETAWQERVLGELRVGDWVRLTATDELDFTGPIAMGVLERHGLLWPPNAFFHAPLIEHAAGGSLLTGVGGDQLTVLWHPRWRALADARARRRRPVVRDAARLLVGSMPASLRALWERRASSDTPPWLTEAAAGRVAVALHRERAQNPLRYDHYLAWMAQGREVAMARESLQRVGNDLDVRVGSPLSDERFLAALARAGGRDGFGGRGRALRHALGELWPPMPEQRAGKATFDEVFWRATSRARAQAWDGRGVKCELVRPDLLRQAWRESEPDLRSALLLQQVALQHTTGTAAALR